MVGSRALNSPVAKTCLSGAALKFMILGQMSFERHSIQTAA